MTVSLHKTKNFRCPVCNSRPTIKTKRWALMGEVVEIICTGHDPLHQRYVHGLTELEARMAWNNQCKITNKDNTLMFDCSDEYSARRARIHQRHHEVTKHIETTDA